VHGSCGIRCKSSSVGKLFDMSLSHVMRLHSHRGSHEVRTRTLRVLAKCCAVAPGRAAVHLQSALSDSWVLRNSLGWDRTMWVSSFLLTRASCAVAVAHSGAMVEAQGAPANSVHVRFVLTTQRAKHPAIGSAHSPASWLAAEGVPGAAVPRVRLGIGVPSTFRLLPLNSFCSERKCWPMRHCELARHDVRINTEFSVPLL